jgi:hypothetical protein
MIGKENQRMATLSKEQVTAALQSILVDLLDGTLDEDGVAPKEVRALVKAITAIDALGTNSFSVATAGRTFVVTVSIPRA